MHVSSRLSRWLAVGGLVLLAACESESYVLVNVTLGNLTVDQISIRGYPNGRLAEQQVSVVPEVAGDSYSESVNLVLVVPESWTDRLVWITAEGMHQGVVVGYGRNSVIPRPGKLVDVTVTLTPGAPPCGNGIIDGGEQCDSTELGGETCGSLTGKPDGSLLCVDCQLDTSECHDCGNGLIDGAEQCDGSDLAGATCQSLGFVKGSLYCTSSCVLDKSACEQGCGNNMVEPPEECDGTNHNFQTCADYGFWRGHLTCTPECTLDDSTCEGYCGDGVLDAGEACDGTDFGAQTCATATGRPQGTLACTGDCHLDVSGCMDGPAGFCGDGVLDPGESCDGSAFGGQTCLTAAGRQQGTLGCTAGCFLDISDCHTCGDGVLESGEECDGLSLAGQTCQSLTGLPDGQLTCAGDCTFDMTDCTSCGDGLVLADEGCDDGNAAAGDGCDAACQVEPGWACAGTPSACSPVDCGDGVLAGAERCDDGNIAAGDGCDGACQPEAGFVCFGEPSTCVADASAIFVDCGLPCTGTGSRSDPLCSVQDAVDATSTSQVIVLLAGTACVEAVTVTKDIHLVGEEGASLDGPTCPSVYVNNADVTVWGLALLQGVEVDNFGSAVVQRCEIGPSPCVGVRCRNFAHCTVWQNRIHDNDDGGLWVSASSYSVMNNLVYRNGLWGTSSRGGMWINANAQTPNDVINNTFAFNEAQDATFDGGIRCITASPLRNNIIWGNTGTQISAACVPWYNIIMDPVYAGWQFNQYVNPMFVNATLDDYHLNPLSPAVNSGDPAGVPPAPPRDLDGVARPQGAGVDLGAYEAQ